LIEEVSMGERAWLDVSIIQCPWCGRYLADASWYVAELESDIGCRKCHKTFSTKKQLTDHVMLEFKIDQKGKTLEAKLTEHI